ncbi:AfsR/SARP family transcriptional regulator [Actinokineospora terrae]|uniref:DNA-binding transcriptional activator of the SARP family n=1 Tax=Actinokineospora terrae TaxID=155974 RepID=A0A1H9T8V6_9PSEU|nr:BTAD domain-containing putative transcriptional regulator [Actinokineospora terrae]SER93700.1 DNA-binding transcriptional activator of the SARP family [Actinokineospora terrae]
MAAEAGRGGVGLWAGLLGPVEARRGGAVLPLGSAGRQAVFAVLALGAGQVVSRDRLVDGLWERPPASAARIIQTYVGDLRRVLEPDRARWTSGRLLRTTDAGYVLDLPDDGVDVRVLDRLRTRSDLDGVDAALALWRGEPLSGVSGPFAEGQRVRLAETRLSLVETRMRLLVDAGRAEDAAAELAVLTEEHPERDSLRALLMTALAAGGRPAQAIEVFHRGRAGPDLLALHERILTGTQPGRVDNGFVGRRAEVAALRAVAARPGGLVLVEGVAGAGKSALLRAALADTDVTWYQPGLPEPRSGLVVVDGPDPAVSGWGVSLVVAARPGHALRARATRVITLGPLGDSDVAALTTALGAPDLAAVAVRESGGSPGFATALVDAGGDTEQVARATTAALAPDLLEPLRRVALLGEYGPRAQVVAAHPGDQWLGAAVAAGVLCESGDHVGFAQPSLRRALLAGLPRAVRVVLHRELAKDLAAAGAPPDRVAHHLLDGAATIHGWASDWIAGNVDAMSPGLAVRLLRYAVGQDALPQPARTGLTAALVRLLLTGEPASAEQGANGK